MEYYRLEFSEEQQWLRTDNYSHPENTNGFMTIKAKCTDMEVNIFEAFLTRTDGLSLDESNIKYRNVDVLEASQELDIFIKSLAGLQLSITSTALKSK